MFSLNSLHLQMWLKTLIFICGFLPLNYVSALGTLRSAEDKRPTTLYERIISSSNFFLNYESSTEKDNVSFNNSEDLEHFLEAIAKGANVLSKSHTALNLKMRLRRSVGIKPNLTENISLTDWEEWTSCNTTQCQVVGIQERRRQCLILGSPATDELMCQAALVEFRNCTILCGGNRDIDTDRPTLAATKLEYLSLLQVSTNRTPALETTAATTLSETTSTQELHQSALGISSSESNLTTAKMETMVIITNPEVVRVWGNWSNWDPCSVSCGAGTQSRNRQCITQGSKPCSELQTEVRRCQNQMNCSFWQEWEEWGPCSITCGIGGIRSRERLCVRNRELVATLSVESTNDVLKHTPSQQPLLDSYTEVINSSFCPGGSVMAEETEPCVVQMTCQRSWSLWRPWSRCSVTCGIGYRSAMRECLGGTIDGEECSGNAIRYKRCHSPPCWSAWSRYSECAKSCGNTGAVQIRERDCIGTSNFVEEYKTCIGLRMQTKACNTQSCPVWGPWSRFSRCSKSCNSGTKVRTRRCLRGRCSGRRREVIRCNYQACPTWSNWSVYTCCSVTCGNGGFKERTRTCRNRGFRPFSSCIGPRRQRIQCSMRPCNETVPSVFGTFECGIRRSRRVSPRPEPILRIFGGHETKRHGWPWQASWQHRACFYCDWIHFCGATLVAPQWVVTASHCTEESAYRVNHNDPGDTWSVVLGMHRLYEDGSRHFIRRVFVHPNYEYVDVTVADVALLKLRQPATLSHEISPVCFPHLSQPTPGETCFITGWGYTASPSNTAAQLSIELLEARVPLMRFSDCQRLGANYKTYLNKQSHLCAGDPVSALSDSCIGDSGGPLVCRRRRNRWYFAGVTSFGFSDCGTRGHVGIYAPVNTYQRWIKTTIESYSLDSC